MKTREALKIHLAANYADTMPDYVDGNYVRGLEEGYKKGWEDADAHPNNPWRDAKKERPKNGEWTLVCNKGMMVEYFMYLDGFWVNSVGEVMRPTPTHWMPIPEPEGGEK